MIRYLTSLQVLILALSLCACSNSDEPEPRVDFVETHSNYRELISQQAGARGFVCVDFTTGETEPIADSDTIFRRSLRKRT